MFHFYNMLMSRTLRKSRSESDHALQNVHESRDFNFLLFFSFRASEFLFGILPIAKTSLTKASDVPLSTHLSQNLLKWISAISLYNFRETNSVVISRRTKVVFWTRHFCRGAPWCSGGFREEISRRLQTIQLGI